MDWQTAIANCIEDDTKRHYLLGINLVLLSSAQYVPDWIYWMELAKLWRN